MVGGEVEGGWNEKGRVRRGGVERVVAEGEVEVGWNGEGRTREGGAKDVKVGREVSNSSLVGVCG